MCGIAAILKFTPKGARQTSEVISETWLDALDASIAQRGPDGRGRYRDAVAALDGSGTVHLAMVHRRLAVIDPAGGRQPMVVASPLPRGAGLAHAALFSGDDGAYQGLDDGDRHHDAIVFNGCIYNHRALRAELAAQGCRFASDHSDTEALLRACTHWQTGSAKHEREGTVLDELDGMFAFAFWSSAKGTLTLGRDLAGEKPLYWMQPDANTLVVCSSAAGVLRVVRLMGHRLKLNRTGAAMWLKHGYWPLMPIDDLHELDPGALLRVTATGDSGLRPAIVAKLRIPGRGGRDAEAPPPAPPTCQGTLEMLRRAVRSRLESDVPMGCFLSGGVDSSIVAALAQEAIGRDRPLTTFTVSMPDAALDEARFGIAVAGHLGTRHHTLDCSAGASTAAADLERLIGQLGLPFGDSSLLPTAWLCGAARQHVTVALGGDGGDELFGGYQRYTASRVLLARAGLLGAAGLVPSAFFRLAGAGGAKLRRVLTASQNFGYQDILTIHTTPQLEDVIAGSTGFKRADVRTMLAGQYASRPTLPDARQDDFDNYLPQDLMRKVDTAGMGVALEVRSPLLERDTVFATLRATLAQVEAGEGRKGLLRQVARQLVPAELVDRPKQGFGIPIGRWIIEDFGGLRGVVEGVLLTPLKPAAEEMFGSVVNRAAIQTLVQQHLAGATDHGQRLYSLTVFALWCKWVAAI